MYDPIGMPAVIRETFNDLIRKQLGDKAIDEYVAQKKREFRDRIAETVEYHPVLRFQLTDEKSRTFAVERMTYSNEGGWYTLANLPLDKAVTRYIIHLGKESFFELI